MPTDAKILRGEVRRHDVLYFVHNAPEISDERYDALLRELRALETAHPHLITPDSPTQRVSEEPPGGFARVRYAKPMLSIDNTYSVAKLREFDQRVRKALGSEPYEYVIDPKIDGVAVSLRYENGLFVQGVTRGDGETGGDVTQNLRAVCSVPLWLLDHDWPAVLEIRGEVYWPRAGFEQFNAKRVAAGETAFANPRSATAGTLKQLDACVVATRGLAFQCHGFGTIEPPPTVARHSELMACFRGWGIPTSPHTRRCGDIEAVIHFVDEWDVRRHQLDYDTDGLVVKIERFDQRLRLGATQKAPRWCMAYKRSGEN